MGQLIDKDQKLAQTHNVLNHCIQIVSWVGLIDVQPRVHQISVVLAIFGIKMPRRPDAQMPFFGHRQSQQTQMG